jgi:hypothetical protein
MVVLQWYPGPDCRTLTRTAIDLDPAADQKDSLPHAGMTEARPAAILRTIEARAIVPHDELQSTVDAPEPDLGPACSGVAYDVAQSLLGDAEETERHLVRQPLGNVAGICIQSN